MARHLSKDEIIRMMKDSRVEKLASHRSPFTGMCTLCCWVLWKTEGWGQERLARYYQAEQEYEGRIEQGEVSTEELSSRLMDKAGWTVEYHRFTEADIGVSKKNKFLYGLAKRQIEDNNRINQLSTQYLLSHYNVLMDMGFGKKRLDRNCEAVTKYLKMIENGEAKVMQMHRELEEKLGIIVQMPDLRQ
jgi:hypothetical protein